MTRILIVDDSAFIRATIRAVLEPVSRDVHECADGAEAIDAYRRLAPDWVLMDIAMRGMDGIQATSRIRAADPAARVIIVSDHGSTQFRAAARTAGAAAFVLKDDLLTLPSLLKARTDEEQAQ